MKKEPSLCVSFSGIKYIIDNFCRKKFLVIKKIGYILLKSSITSFRKTIIFLKNNLVYAILLVDLFMEKIHET